MADAPSATEKALQAEEEAWRKHAFHQCAMAAGKVFIDRGVLGWRVDQLRADILEEMSMFVVAKYAELKCLRLEKMSKLDPDAKLRASPFV